MSIYTYIVSTRGSQQSDSPRINAEEKKRREREEAYVDAMKKAYKTDLPLQLFLDEDARRKASM